MTGPAAGRRERVVDNLNRALHTLLAADPRLYLLGEDVLDPYGGAFKVTRGLSTRYPEQVLGTPLSEGAIVGAASGLALAGDAAIAEIMFADFAALAFDQLLNFASKSVAMYGRRIPLRMVVRCPTGGNRGYGPTHSQSLHKHFLGIPGLSLFEVSPFHDNRAVLERMLALGEPCLLFEDKVLYTRWMCAGGVVDDLFGYDLPDGAGGVARVRAEDDNSYDCVLVAPGGLAHRVMAAMRALLLDEEVSCMLLVPSRLYPVDVEGLLPHLERGRLVCVVEDSTAGGTWGGEVAHQVSTRLWGRLARPVRLVHAAASVIPAAPHLERRVLVQDTTIRDAVTEALR